MGLLRLEADKVATGALGMAIFAADRHKPAQRSFKVRIDEICPQWGTKVYETAQMPSLGFTQLAPPKVDALGGLPKDWQSMADSICMRVDGSVFVSVGGETKQVAEAVAPSFNYEINVGDNLELIWSS